MISEPLYAGVGNGAKVHKFRVDGDETYCFRSEDGSHFYGLLPNLKPAAANDADADKGFVTTMRPTLIINGEPHQIAAPAPAFSQQIGGDHYTRLAIQPFEYSMANQLNPFQHTIVKYVTRAGMKGDLFEQIDKAIHTLQLWREWEQRQASAA